MSRLLLDNAHPIRNNHGRLFPALFTPDASRPASLRIPLVIVHTTKIFIIIVAVFLASLWHTRERKERAIGWIRRSRVPREVEALLCVLLRVATGSSAAPPRLQLGLELTVPSALGLDELLEIADILDALPEDHALVRLDDADAVWACGGRGGRRRGRGARARVVWVRRGGGLEGGGGVVGGGRAGAGDRVGGGSSARDVQHALWDESGEFADLFVDVVPATALDCVVALSAPAALLVCEHGLFVGGRGGLGDGVWVRGGGAGGDSVVWVGMEVGLLVEGVECRDGGEMETVGGRGEREWRVGVLLWGAVGMV